MRAETIKALAAAVAIIAAVVGSLLLARYIENNDTARQLIEQSGYLGILIVSIISGLNLFVPVPAVTFTPIYVSAGFPLPAIIILLTIGTVIADTVGYLIGVGGKHITKSVHPKFQKKMEKFFRAHHRLMMPFVFAYATLSPFPNEVILIPLAIIGVRFRVLALPLVAGTLVYHTAFAYGITGLFHYFF